MSSAFQIVSDLHLETQQSYLINLPHTATNIALLGDIGKVADHGLFQFLEKLLNNYWNVFYVLGNHEPLGTTWSTAKASLRSFAARMENLRQRSTIGRFILLDQTRYDISDELTILGCTLFSHVTDDQAGAVGDRLVDFKQICNWTVDDHNQAHASDLAWLISQVSKITATEPQRRIAIMTHHSPTIDSRAADPKHIKSPVSSGFSTDLSRQICWQSKSVVFWAFGHTHFNCDFVDELGKRVVANQRGYASVPRATFNMKSMYFPLQKEAENMGLLL